MSQKVAIITGANSGLGLHTAKKLFGTGNYKLVLACRSEQKTRLAINEIINAHPNQNSELIKFLKLDLTSSKSIHNFVNEFKLNYDGLDLLINNAGIMNHPHELTTEGIEIHLGTNHVGHWILTRELLNQLKFNSRIVIISSGLYKKATMIPDIDILTNIDKIKVYKPTMLYSISKLANCLHVKYLDDYLKNQTNDKLKSVKVFAIRPGFVRGTELGRHTPWILRTVASPLIWMIAKNLDQGIEGIIHCSTGNYDELDSGCLYYGNIKENFEETVTLEKAKELEKMTELLVKNINEENASGDH